MTIIENRSVLSETPQVTGGWKIRSVHYLIVTDTETGESEVRESCASSSHGAAVIRFNSCPPRASR